jgi:hypothetical protein
MYLLRSWQESLKLFLPSNFKLFMLTVLKSAVETYGYLMYYFWWLVLIFALLFIGSMNMDPELLAVMPAEWMGSILGVTGMLLWLVLILIVRPSLREKGPVYFKQSIKKNILGFFAYVVLWSYARFYIGNIFMYLLYQVGLLEQHIAHIPILSDIVQFKGMFFFWYISMLYFWMPLILLPGFLFSVLFFADSEGSLREWLRSLWRAVKMVVYNWPFIFLSLVVFLLIGIALLMFFYSLRHAVAEYFSAASIIFFCLIPFIVTYLKNFYIKRVHDQFKLYFPGT